MIKKYLDKKLKEQEDIVNKTLNAMVEKYAVDVADHRSHMRSMIEHSRLIERYLETQNEILKRLVEK